MNVTLSPCVTVQSHVLTQVETTSTVRLRCKTDRSNLAQDIIVGGKRGFLRAVRTSKVDSVKRTQDLPDHHGELRGLAFNATRNVFASYDQTGQILVCLSKRFSLCRLAMIDQVWGRWRDEWFEEMINNRNHSCCSDLQWFELHALFQIDFCFCFLLQDC